MKDLINKSYFSPGTDCLNVIIATLRSALTSIDICVFTIADDRITREIIYMYRCGVNVRVITDNDKCYDLGSDIEELVKYKVPVKVDKTRYHMHHKFMVIDKKYLVTGSYNWTRSACNNNHENILLSDHKEITQGYTREFEKLWDEMEWY